MRQSDPVGFRLLGFLTLAAVLIAPATGTLRAVEAAPAVQVEGAPRMHGVSYRFFDDRTGAAIGSLRIGLVDMEYRRQGFMRVAWKPLVVLKGVNFEASSDMEWPVQGVQVVHALLALGGREELVFREVRVHLAGQPDRELVAASARLLPDGVLELSEAVMNVAGQAGADTRKGTYRLALTGQNAGRVSRPVIAAMARNQNLSNDSN